MIVFLYNGNFCCCVIEFFVCIWNIICFLRSRVFM